MYIVRYDRFHSNYNSIYEVESIVTYFNGDRFVKEPQSASLKEVLEKNVPELKLVTRVAERSYKVSNSSKAFEEDGIYADENFFDLFTFPVADGKPEISLSDISSIAVSERLAMKLFGTVDCDGKTITLGEGEGQQPFKIDGVFRDVPVQSTLQFDFVIPFAKFVSDNPQAMDPGASVCGVWVQPGEKTDIRYTGNKIRDLIKDNPTTLNQELMLFPIKEKMLYTYTGQDRVWKEMQRLVIAGGTGMAILLISCFNFLNLAVAMNIRRHREVGVKIVNGVTKSGILFQFLGETFILVFFSLLAAIMLTRALMAGFNTMFSLNIQFSITDIPLVLIIAAVVVFTGIIAGLFPAVYLSSADPVIILRGGIIKNQSFSTFRQGLVVFQFVIPVVLVICMMIIKVQDRFIRNYDIGFDREELIVINNTNNLEAHSEGVVSDLITVPGVEAVSFTSCIPARGTGVTNEVKWEGMDINSKLHFWRIKTDYGYNTVAGLKMKAGRYFDKSFPSDSSCYVINDIAADVMNLADPVGKTITVEGRKGIIIGVFSGFHTVDLAGPYTPTIVSLDGNGRHSLLVRFTPGNYAALIEKIGHIYNRYEKEVAFEPVLFSDLPDFSGLSRMSGILGVAFVIAMMLACLGLSGLSSFTAESHVKEIGIRKVNGATASSVMIYLLRNYASWLTVSFIIAIPLAYFAGTIFLSRFHFAAPMPYRVFITGPLISLCVALGTISFQTWKAARRNPVDALSSQ